MTNNQTHTPMAGIAICFAGGILANNILHYTIPLLIIYILCILTITPCILASLPLNINNKKSTSKKPLSIKYLLLNMRVRTTKIINILILISFFLLGCIYSQQKYIPASNDVRRILPLLIGKDNIMVKGTITSDLKIKTVLNKEKYIFTLQLKAIDIGNGWINCSGKILVNSFTKIPDILYGDMIILKGKLYRPHNFNTSTPFSYRNYLARQDIYSILSVKKDTSVSVVKMTENNNIIKRIIYKTRKYLKAILERTLSTKEAGIMKALLLGDRSHIPKYIKQLFIETGTAHILAISGLHVGIIAGIVVILFKTLPIPRAWQFFMAILSLIAYALITGARPSVIRATIMMCIFLGGVILEREQNLLNTISVAAFIILISNPFSLFDIGFQLSFACVLSIILFADKIKAFFIKRIKILQDGKIYGKVKGILILIIYSVSISFAVWIGIAGLIAYYFHIITPITVLANLFVIPLLFIIITLGLGTLFSGIICPACTFMFAACLKLFLNIMVGIIFLLDKIPFSHIYLQKFPPWLLAIYYSCVFILLSLLHKSILFNMPNVTNQQG